jgi:hypothetical protein
MGPIVSRFAGVLVVFICGGVTPAQGAAGTNEPEGFTQLTTRSFQATNEDSWANVNGSGRYTIQTVNGPEGDNSVGQMIYEEGYEAGNGPANVYRSISGSRTKLFIRLKGFRVSSNWYGPSSSINKIFFIWHGTGPNLYLQAIGSGSGTLYFRVNTQLPSTYPDSTLGGSTLECVRGSFYDIEMLFEENAVAGATTGVIRAWGKLSSASSWTKFVDVTNVNYWDSGGTRYFDGEQRWNPTWGGLSSWTVPEEQYQQVDAAYMSGSSA